MRSVTRKIRSEPADEGSKATRKRISARCASEGKLLTSLSLRALTVNFGINGLHIMNRLPVSVAACLIGLTITTATHARNADFLDKSADKWQRELNDSDAKVRRSAAFALGRIGAAVRSAAPDLARRLLKDDDAGVRDMAASAIGDIAKALQGAHRALWNDAGGTLILALKKDKDARVRRSAAYALGSFGPPASGTVDVLSAALKDADSSVRQNAAWALGQIGENAGGAATVLCGCLHDKDALVRRDAAGALGSIGKAASSAVAPLIDLVKSEPDEVVRTTAVNSLSHLAGPEHAEFAAGLEPLLTDKNAELKLNAAIVLARIGGPQSARALPVLQAALKDSDAHTQEMAAASLANLGPIAEPAVLDLADVLTNASNSAALRRLAALAIGLIGPARPPDHAGAKPAVSDLALALKTSESVEIRLAVAEALAHIQYPTNKSALPAILKSIENDSNPEVRQRCIWALFTLQDPDEFKRSGADKVLEKVLDEPPSDSTNLVRYNAARKLASMLEANSPDKTADVLLHMLHNKSLHVFNRTEAKVEGSGTEATQAKANVKENTGGDARFMAVKALGWLKSKAAKNPKVIEALEEAAKDDSPTLSKEAKKVLAELKQNK